MVAPREQQGALIPQFYAGRSVFITGATGFVGKVLVERLLFTCPDIARLVLLLRAKKGVAPQQRLRDLKESQVFDVVRQRCPQQLDKLVALEGDVGVENLGLAPGAAQQLQDISVVFHSAATLKFDEGLRKAVDQNVRSVMRMLELCDTLPNMQAFVHVSTAYSNAELSTVAEKVYPAPAPLPAVLALTTHVDDSALASLTQQYISPKPNTYTFTKALGECAVERHGNTGYPIAIFRPTIVTSALQHPFPGWIENLNGPTGVVVAIGKGVLHVIRCASHTNVDFLPVDISADTLIAVAWETAIDKPNEVRVYHCSTVENPTTFKAFEKVIRRAVTQDPFDKALWYPSGAAVESKWAYLSMEFLTQKAPLFLADHCARLLGIKTQQSLITVGQRVSAMNSALEFFSTREWHFETGRMQALRQRMSPADRLVYNLDVATIHWDEHSQNFVKGIRKYLLRERDQDIDSARRHMRNMWILHQTMKYVSLLLLLRLILQNRHANALVYGTVRLLLSLFSAVYGRLWA